MKWRKIKEKERESKTHGNNGRVWHRTPNAFRVFTCKCTQNIVNMSCQDSCVCSSFLQILFWGSYHAFDSICFENRSNSIWNSLNAICFFWSLNYFSSNFRRRLYNIFGNEWWARSKSFQKEIACKAKYDTYLFSAMLMTYKIRMNEWTNFKINFKVSLDSLKLSIIAP